MSSIRGEFRYQPIKRPYLAWWFYLLPAYSPLMGLLPAMKLLLGCLGFPLILKNFNSGFLHYPNSNLKLGTVIIYMGVNTKHWPPNAPQNCRGRYVCPSVPPSCFSSNIPKSSIPSTSTTQTYQDQQSKFSVQLKYYSILMKQINF